METKKKRTGLLGKIENREGALKTIKESAYAFIFIALLQGAIGVFLAPSTLIDAALFLICAILLMWLKSRTVAIVLLLMSLGAVIMTVLNKIGVSTGGGSNIILAIIILFAAVKATEATFKLHGKYKVNANSEQSLAQQSPS